MTSLSGFIGNPYEALRNRSFRLRRQVQDGIKRVLDIVVSLIVLFILAPFFGLLAVAIKRDSPGPVFYRGWRMGRNGKPFKILKFRTMYESPESYQGPKVTARNDPRVTRIGTWLRETKLNELPQFWNVLKGEMSLVGPRPEDPAFASTWPENVFKEITSVRPGITSPASIQYRNEENLLPAGSVMQKYLDELAPDKMRLDQLYVRHRSFWLDIDVLLWTTLVLLPKIRAITVPEHLLFVGPATRLARRHLSWFTVDLLVTFFAIGSTGLVWRAFGPLHIGWLMAVGMAAGFALLFSICNALMGVNRVKWSQAADSDVFDLLPAWSLAAALAVVFNAMMGHFPTQLVLAAAFLALLGFVVVRYHMRLITGFLSRIVRYRRGVQAAGERVVIVGSGPAAQMAAWMFSHPANAFQFVVVGFIEDDLFKQGTRIYGAEVIGASKDISRIVKTHDVGVIVVADRRFSSRGYQEILDQCKESSVRLVVIPDVFAVLQDLAIDSRCGWQFGDAGKNHVPESPCLYCLAQLAFLNQSIKIEDVSSLKEGGDLQVAQ